MSRFLDAMSFLTIFPIRRWSAPTPDQMGSSMVFFPFVGAILGLILVLVASFLYGLIPTWVLAAILVGLLIAMTGGLHWDGVADTFDGLAGAKGDRQRMLDIMKDARIGAIGVLALVFLVVFKVVLMGELYPDRWRAALILMPMIGRFLQVELAAWGHYARPEAGTGHAFVEGVTSRDFYLALAGVVVISLLAGGWRGLIVLLLCLAYGYGVMAFFNRKIGGITGDILGMVSETGEILALLLFFF
ncbi:MAG: adenosylcobinamide-GDP ribazoletransferase [Deltaproteobacteria bacterium]|nr:MAG: adenosylcobinamide-GDP ribazoletransferase [Deltaproteobacteria bacterium]